SAGLVGSVSDLNPALRTITSTVSGNGFSSIASVLNANGVIHLGSILTATVQTAVTNSPGLVIGIAASLPQMLSLSSIPSVHVSSAVQVNGSGSALSVGTNPSGQIGRAS